MGDSSSSGPSIIMSLSQGAVVEEGNSRNSIAWTFGEIKVLQYSFTNKSRFESLQNEQMHLFAISIGKGMRKQIN